MCTDKQAYTCASVSRNTRAGTWQQGFLTLPMRLRLLSGLPCTKMPQGIGAGGAQGSGESACQPRRL